ncbi:MAG TPA: ATP-binding protein [Thermoanaerobaculia bacterium]
MGQTRVDLQHLLEDIRDAYPGSLEETIVTEIVANSLDSGARSVRLEPDAAQATLTVIDDGSGMARRELARYHDIAASTKAKGEGIGFAGVGIKLGILASEEVLTETRRAATHVATSWRLASRHRAPWHWVPPPGLVGDRGTAVRLKLRNPLSPLLESGFLEAALVRHFQPLFDPAFAEILADHYPDGVRFAVAGIPVGRLPDAGEPAGLSIRLARKRRPSAVGRLLRVPAPLPEDQQGLAVSTLGKVIKRGWDWLGLSPIAPDRVAGLIEVPALAGCLTLNKADFIRTGGRGALYLAHRKAIQEAVAAQLAAWGDAREDAVEEEARRRKTRPVERDLAAVLAEMTDDFPLVASLVERRAGGQKKLPIPNGRTALSVAAAPAWAGLPGPGADGTVPKASSPSDDGPLETDNSPSEERADDSVAKAGEAKPPGSAADLGWPAGRGRRRLARLALSIQFESRPDDPELGRLVESTVRVNDGHPAYRRAAASRAEGYHIALTVALALATLAVEPSEAHRFVTAFLAHWGEAVDRPIGAGRQRRRGAVSPRRER